MKESEIAITSWVMRAERACLWLLYCYQHAQVQNSGNGDLKVKYRGSCFGFIKRGAGGNGFIKHCLTS